MTIDLSPFYRNAIGFDTAHALLERFATERELMHLPQYNIESITDDRFSITLAVAGFTQEELMLEMADHVLYIRGKLKSDSENANYLYCGIPLQDFELKFQLADFVAVSGAVLINGLLRINLVRNIPEESKPRKIRIIETHDLTDATVGNRKGEEKAA